MTYRQVAWDLAVGQYGYITSDEATDLSIPTIELVKMANWDKARGVDGQGIARLRRIGHGLYRFDSLPTTRVDQFYEAVALVGRDAHLTRDAVLAFHDLALVNPRRVRVGTPHRVRTRLPGWIEMVHENAPPDALTTYELVPSTTVAYAIEDCIPIVMGERLLDAVTTAEQHGLVTRAEAASLRAKIGPR